MSYASVPPRLPARAAIERSGVRPVRRDAACARTDHRLEHDDRPVRRRARAGYSSSDDDVVAASARAGYSSSEDDEAAAGWAAAGIARFFAGPEYHLREIHMNTGDARKIDE